MHFTLNTVFFKSSPVTGLAASFGSLTACRQSKNGEASSLIEAKAAAFRLRPECFRERGESNNIKSVN
ncbi:MAG: hypothetical protein ABJB11_13400 [Ferruginibacter sp.]